MMSTKVRLRGGGGVLKEVIVSVSREGGASCFGEQSGTWQEHNSLGLAKRQNQTCGRRLEK